MFSDSVLIDIAFSGLTFPYLDDILVVICGCICVLLLLEILWHGGL